MRCRLLLIAICFVACHSINKPKVRVTIDHHQQSVSINGLSDAALYGLKTHSISIDAWQTLLTVCKMPADTELRSAAPIQPGSYALVNNNIVFKPDTPFVKGATYFARYYHFDDGLNSVNMITDKRKPGKTPYTELVFKY